ncbi:MAG: amidohydrolase family protein [Pyrinomonadaceae bacterium]
MRATLVSILLACLMSTFVPRDSGAQQFEADFVILSRDIFKIDPVEIENVRVRMTITGGRVVYEKRD